METLCGQQNNKAKSSCSKQKSDIPGTRNYSTRESREIVARSLPHWHISGSVTECCGSYLERDIEITCLDCESGGLYVVFLEGKER